jgi:8-amino-7-oxononanoate synthase
MRWFLLRHFGDFASGKVGCVKRAKLVDGSIEKRIDAMCGTVNDIQDAGLYFYNMPVSEMREGAKVLVNGREMEMFASYSYLGLIGHPRINAAAIEAVERYGTGTHGVRTLAGTLPIHQELEETIATFKHTEDAVTFSSGYVTNLSVISTLVGRHDYVFSDKLNHASIVDGCLLSGANFVRFRHNDLDDLRQKIESVPASSSKLVVADAVFSMDGDIIDLPKLSEICRANSAWLMIDEAHSIGVLGDTGHGIEEHFGLEDVIDIKMGTLSKTIPSVGGYVAGPAEMIKFLRHRARGYIFTAALPPAQAGAANAAFQVILDEPWRVKNLTENSERFLSGLGSLGFDTLCSETAVVPVICGSDESAYQMTRSAQEQGLFMLPVVSPAVPEGLARLRATVTAAHSAETIDRAIEVIGDAGRTLGLI